MQSNAIRIDLVKLIVYVLKRIWLPILCGAIGFGAMYYNTAYRQTDTYTAYGTMYVYNGNPNLVNYQYASANDLDSAVRLIDTYQVVIKSNKVMDVVAERLSADYEGINPRYIAATLGMSSVGETGVVRVSSVTADGQMSADIVNAVLDVAPEEIIRVVGAGKAEIIDYASVPYFADDRGAMRKGILGAMAGVVAAGGVLILLFLFNRKITDTKDLTDMYTPPILASIKRSRQNSKNAGEFLITEKSPMETLEGYAKLRMNLIYTLVGKNSNSVIITSAVSGEGKSTIASNLAISCAMGGKKVLLVDSDLRRACQRDIFGYDSSKKGLSEILVGESKWQDCIMKNVQESTLDLLPAGQLPPNPAELLSSDGMKALLKELEDAYELVLLDMPPINIVTDPLVLSSQVGGGILVTRQNYSDHRDLKKALIEAEMTGLEVLGFVFYGEKVAEGSYYSRKRYENYYHKYDNRDSKLVK